jgi:anti-sigma regulatory factor (Ser/Thr protein kinase)
MLARYGNPDEPPVVDAVCGDEAALIEELYCRTASGCRVPAIAVREIIENLVHADFRGATVSIFDAGNSVRIADCGPGIADKDRAMQPGFSTACERARSVVRGVGSGLGVAARAMAAVDGTIEIADNLGGGTVVTLATPADGADAPAPAEVSENGRRILALLVEMAPAAPSALAKELEMSLGICGRELVVLEHRGLVARAEEGARLLTLGGANLISTLF